MSGATRVESAELVASARAPTQHARQVSARALSLSKGGKPAPRWDNQPVPTTATSVFISRIRNLPVLDDAGDQVGKVRDVVVQRRPDGRAPRVKGLVVELFARHRIFIPMARVHSIDAVQVVISGVVNTRRFERRDSETHGHRRPLRPDRGAGRPSGAVGDLRRGHATDPVPRLGAVRGRPARGGHPEALRPTRSRHHRRLVGDSDPQCRSRPGHRPAGRPADRDEGRRRRPRAARDVPRAPGRGRVRPGRPEAGQCPGRAARRTSRCS